MKETRCHGGECILFFGNACNPIGNGIDGMT